MPLARIAVEFGYEADPSGALEASENYCQCAARMGGSWVMLDPMSKQLMFLFVRVALGWWINQFERCVCVCVRACVH
eukprot:10832768-Alexandrium_andersonii.AAC.1